MRVSEIFQLDLVPVVIYICPVDYAFDFEGEPLSCFAPVIVDP